MEALLEAIERARSNDDPYLEDMHVAGETLEPGTDLGFFEFHGIELEQCSLVGINLAKASFYDCTLIGCDLSNANLTEAFLTRTRLVACKLTGASLNKAILRSIRLIGCQCRYLNAGEAKLEGTVLEDCDLRESFLSELRLQKRSRLERCSLVRADLFRTVLKGVDLSTCDITGIAVSDTRAELRGALISTEQAVDVAALLGVRIVEYS